ncbi:UvrD-helicase domain-containing protein [Stenotrophomonas sp. CFBP 13725]|uniref:UvrD-helicase domain-containing protein n=1 Tax=Stenotrophomonas sp. CFBP 13725 TaxID=2775297 RepID=UPI0017802900|nr:UvrD-helicase domain-containing protein [Stenotrophomonas sp. CFBP 13725]MBD8636714.1 UvrD-helicase domain-containing protein [Stenotrophomonas sp. CFBP 13725]
MAIAVLVWQAIIFFSIALAGRARGWVVAFWIVWTILQVFALWLSVVQFGTVWLAWTIFGCKKTTLVPAQRTPPLPRPVDPPQEQERLAQAEFDSAFKAWRGHMDAVINGGRWIPKSMVRRFLIQHPAPQHRTKTWKQAVRDSSPEDTLRSAFEKHNKRHLASQRMVRKAFFDTVEKNPLTAEQVHACICMDDAVMVVAAAGSGKTSTMVAKTGYALHEGLATPEQILLLAFNRATADEVGSRIAEQLKDVPNVGRVRSNTFHAFGIEVIAKARGKKPSLAPWVSPDNPGADIREVSNIIKTLSGLSDSFKRDWDQFRTIYARDVGKWGQRQEPDAYIDGKRGFLTAQGDVVKSKEERVIANWLFYNGVAYAYARAYEHETATEHHRQYFPDFYYPDAQLYHEHFALNAKGEAPEDFKGYLEGVAWKRQLHADMGTALVETTSHGLMTGESITVLERALVERGVTPVFDPSREGVGMPPVEEADLARSFRVFQQHVKNNGLSHAQLEQALHEQAQDGYGARLRMYLSIYERIAQEWERRLRAGQYVDFEDMLIQAAGHVESGAYASPYQIILADEFQDSSRARIRLLRALAANPGVPTHLCVVGDDWQGINRFAGSDISVMTEFEMTFDYATRLTLNTTFRCPQHLCDVSSQFVQANPAQIRKQVTTTNPLKKAPMQAYGFQDEGAVLGYIEQQLSDMHRYVGEGKLVPAKGARVTVLFLGRYRRDRPHTLERWQEQFGDRLAIDFKTAHGSKGLEAEYVFVLTVLQGTHGFPSQIQDDPALQLAMPAPDPFPFAEERRLFYVAMTRARKQLRFYTTLAQPSQFLVELVKNDHLKIEPVDGEGVEPCSRPDCGGVMVPRSGGAFLGCSRFPACDCTRSVHPADDEIPRVRRLEKGVVVGQDCPACGQGVIQQKNGRNGPFLGCSRYRDGCRVTGNVPAHNS